MNVMITGCAGFIGSHAVDHFLANGHKVTGIDCFTYAASADNIKYQYDNPNFKLFHLNICDTGSIGEICRLRNIEWIINFAAETHVDNSIKSCNKFIDSNITGVKSLLDICRGFDVRLFHISTDEVYGHIRDGSFKETHPLEPRNPYSATKASAEHMIMAYHNTHQVDYLMVRPSNNYGPHQNEEKFLPKMLSSLHNKKRIPIYGDGKNIREWTYVKDTVRAIEFIMNNSELNTVYNISTNNEIENIKLVEKVCSLLGLDYQKHIEFVRDRKGHDFRYSIDNTKLSNLGFSVNDKFEDNLLETIEYYRSIQCHAA